MTPDEQLEAQLERLRSDEHIIEKVRPWLELTPAERLVALDDLCDFAISLASRQPPEVLERVHAIRSAPPPADSLLALARLYGP